MKLPPIKVLPPKKDFRTELLGIAANQAFVIYDSPARQQMYTNSHLAQKLVTFGMSENFLSTDMAEVLAQATFNIISPCNARILKVVPRYPDNNIGDGIAINPETFVWYENDSTKEVGCIIIPRYKSYHPYFGYDLVPQPGAALLTPTNPKPIPAGTILFDSPGRSPVGRYMHGVMANTVFMGHPGTAEDGLIVSRSILKAFRFKRYERRTMEWGDKTFPLNLYGDENVYKICPEIGELVRDDGLLCATRDINRRLAPVDMSVNGTRRVDGTGDHLLYAKGKGGRVVDIIVTLNYEFDTKGLADVNQQLLKYIKARKRFNTKMIEEYMRLYKSRPGLTVTKELHSQILQCMKDEGYNGQKFFKVFKKVGLDQIRVEFIIEYEVEPNIGFKLTESHGGKGIIVGIKEDHEMPMDIYGRYADIIQASEARTNRMNSGGLHEMFYNDAGWHVRRRVLGMLGIPFFEGITLRDRNSMSYDRDKKLDGLRARRMLELEQLHRENPALIEGVWEFVINYYRKVAPYQAHQYDKYDSIPWKGVYSNLANIIEDMTYLNIPPEYAIDYFGEVGNVRDYVGFKRDVVTYTGYSGVPCTTERPHRIAPMYWMLLEKTGDTWSAVSFAKVQQYGFLAQINSSDRYSDPGRPQPIKGAGETEFRIIVSTCGQVASAELADRNNNPKARRQLHRTILTHPTPGNIENAINRDEIQYGGHRAVQIFHHYLNCGGIALAYAEEEGT